MVRAMCSAVSVSPNLPLDCASSRNLAASESVVCFSVPVSVCPLRVPDRSSWMRCALHTRSRIRSSGSRGSRSAVVCAAMVAALRCRCSASAESTRVCPRDVALSVARRRNRAGARVMPLGRALVMIPSLSGSRSASRTILGNSSISSRRRMPLWARAASPRRWGSPGTDHRGDGNRVVWRAQRRRPRVGGRAFEQPGGAKRKQRLAGAGGGRSGRGCARRRRRFRALAVLAVVRAGRSDPIRTRGVRGGVVPWAWAMVSMWRQGGIRCSCGQLRLDLQSRIAGVTAGVWPGAPASGKTDESVVVALGACVGLWMRFRHSRSHGVPFGASDPGMSVCMQG